MVTYYDDPAKDPRTDENKFMIDPEKDRYTPSKVFLYKPHIYGIQDRSKVDVPKIGA